VSSFERLCRPLPASAKEYGHALRANAWFGEFAARLIRIVPVLLDVMRFHHVVARFGTVDIPLLHGSSFCICWPAWDATWQLCILFEHRL
jgi:hypothetical protein